MKRTSMAIILILSVALLFAAASQTQLYADPLVSPSPSPSPSAPEPTPEITYITEIYPTAVPPTEKPVKTPKLKLSAPSMVTVKSGQSQDVDITVKNVGSSYANNYLTQATTTGDTPFTIEFLNKSNSGDFIYDGSSKTMQMRVTADKNAKAGNYTVTLNHAYKNDYNENFSETDTLVVKIENPSAAPNVILHDIQSDQAVVAPGQGFTVTAVVENASTFEASDVQIQIEGLDSTNLHMSGSSNTTYYRTITPQYQTTASFSLSAYQKAKKGTYPLTFKVKYKGSDHTAYENSYVYYVNIDSTANDTAQAAIAIRNMKEPSGSYQVGNEFAVSFDLVNSGKIVAKNVKITAASLTEGAVVPRSSNVQVIQSFDVAESKSFTFRFAGTSQAVSQNYAISFKVEYETGETTDDNELVIQSFEQYAGVNIVNPKADKEEEDKNEDDQKISKPKIIIASYRSDPIIARAGQEFDLDLVFQNTHSEKSINNIKATLTAVETTEKKGSVFTPVDGSNTFFIDSIGPKGTSEKRLRMYTVPDADPRTYTISVRFKYQDADFNEYEEEEIIGINVKQVTKFETSTYSVPEQAMIGSPVYVNFNIINSGKVALSNTKVNIEGNFDTAAASMYLGKITVGGSVYYDGSFTCLEPGQQSGRMIISCEDDTGEPMELVQEFSIMVTDMPPMEMPSDMEMQAEEPSVMNTVKSVAKNPFVYIGIVAAAAIIFFVAKKLRAKKKEMDFDE